jgi:hypothetical protein
MFSTRKGMRWSVGALAFMLVLATTAGAADVWVQVAPDGTLDIRQNAQAQSPQLRLLGYDERGIELTVDVAGVALAERQTEAGAFLSVTWPEAAPSGDIGAPQLPVVRRLFIARPGAIVTLETAVGLATVLDEAAGFSQPVMPRQAPIPKLPGAIENAPFDFDAAAYAIDGEYLAAPATVEELGIVRGQRLFLLEVHPVAYNPVAGTLTLRSQIEVAIRFEGGGPPAAISPLPGLDRIVLNPDADAPSKRGTGNYLIVVSTTYESDVASFAAAKGAQGFDVITHAVAPGTSGTTIKNYIQGLWGTADQPDYLLLVGDTNTIPHWIGQGYGSPDTDLPYACMDGPSDWYPDMAIGRFPVRSSLDVSTLVDKTLYYEDGPLADPEYKRRAAFMAGSDNYQITEGTHNYVIETWLEPAGYQCDRLYEVSHGATTQDVIDAFNDGRFYGVFSGHGSTTSWVDGPPFSQANVNSLTNENMYAFICSFACYTGSYALAECFMETWVLAPNKAGLCSWGSSVTSYWTEDDILERVLFDAIFDNSDDIRTEAGPIYNEAKMRYLDHFGATPTTRRYFEMYNLMGDPSLPLPSTCSDAGEIALDRNLYACESTAWIEVSDCGLNLDDEVVETVDITMDSDTEPAGETVTLVETDAGSAQFRGSIVLSATDDVGVLQVSEGDTVTATYIDEDDGQGGTNVEVTDTATVDCTPPEIWNVQTIDIEPHSVTVTFESNERVRGIIHYGLSCGNLAYTATGSYGNPAVVDLTGLQDGATYYYVVVAEDEAGNQTTDDNGGACYSFATPDVPDFFTESFESGGNDLDYLSLTFTPDGSPDYYAGCVEEIDELPTDPAGGTSLVVSEDSYQHVSLSGGATVSLYGVSYSGFYVCDNGYITFTGGDTDYTESLEDHFEMPRISLLFDDLSIDEGTVRWMQLDDRAVVTFEDVPEWDTSNSNTFQVEMYFNGDIRMSYLSLDANDGIAGLSEGDGVPADYYPSDLSALPPCGPNPPIAEDGAAATEANTAVMVTLLATDDGLPDPPGALSYIIVALPEHGTLSDPGADLIETVPYTLVGGGTDVLYTPDLWYLGGDSFTFKANDGGEPPEGGDSNVATISVAVEPPPLELVYSYALDSDPGWSTEGQWAFGQPTGGGSHYGDPTSAHTGDNVYGYNLSGDYSNNMPVYYLTTTAIDCHDVLATELRFWRWLGVERSPFDNATVEVSADGGNWTPVWANPTTTVSDASWNQMSLDIFAVADGESTVYVRWSMGPTDHFTTYPGWNIDDVEIWGVVVPQCPGDLDGDGDIDLNDLSMLLAHYGMTSGASYADGDLDGDGDVDLDDLTGLLSHYGEICR